MTKVPFRECKRPNIFTVVRVSGVRLLGGSSSRGWLVSLRGWATRTSRSGVRLVCVGRLPVVAVGRADDRGDEVRHVVVPSPSKTDFDSSFGGTLLREFLSTEE